MASSAELQAARDEVAQVFSLFPRELRSDLRKILETEESKARMNASLALSEGLTLVVNRRILTMYEASASSRAESIERDLLRTVDESKLAFGQEIGFLRTYLESAATLGSLGAGQVVGAACPPACDALRKCWDLVKVARQEFRSTPVGAWAYARPRIQRGTTTLLDFLGAVVNIRNAQAHEKDPKWSMIWDDSKEWFDLIDEYLYPAVLALLRWEPIQPILTGWEEVRVQQTKQLGPSHWRSEVLRDLDDVPIGGRLVDSAVELAPDRGYLFKRTDRRLVGPPREVVSRAAVAGARKTAVRAAYRSFYVEHVLSCAMLDGQDKVRLDAEQRVRGLDDETARRVRQESWGVLRAALAHPRSEDATAELRMWLRAGDGGPTLDQRLEDCARQIAAAVRQFVDDVAADGRRVVLVADVAGELGIDAVVAERELAKVAVGEREEAERLGSARSYVEIAAPSQGQRFREVVEASIAQASAGEPFWSQDRTIQLMTLLNEVFPEAHRQSLEVLSEFVPRVASGVKSPRTPARSVDITLQGRTFSIGSVTEFFRELYAAFGSDPLFLASLPWRWGRVRRLAAFSAEAEGDRNAMTYPVGLPEKDPVLFFDANATRDDVAYCAVQNLRDANMSASLVVSPSESWTDAEGVPMEDLQPGELQDPIGVILSVPGRHDSLVIAGAQAGVFAARWLRFMVDEGLFSFRDFPLRLGRSKVLVSLRPDHGRPDRPFASAVRYRGVYLDTAMPASALVEAILGVLDELEIPARSLRVGDDAEDRDEGDSDGPRAWYVNVGGRSWSDMRRFGFWQAGGGARYRHAVERLCEGDEVFAYVSGRGYVGYGVVRGPTAARLEAFLEAKELRPEAGELDQRTREAVGQSRALSDDLAEYAIAVDWRATREEEAAVRVRGMFTTPLTACRLTHAATLEVVRARLLEGDPVTGSMEVELVARYGEWPKRFGKPKALLHSSGEIPVKSWRDVLLAIAEFVVPMGAFAVDTPIQGTNRPVLSSGDLDAMVNPVALSNGWWIETNWNAADCVKIAGGLLLAAGHDPASFSVRYTVPRGGDGSDPTPMDEPA